MNSWVVFGVGQKNCATGWHCGGFADKSFPRCRVLLYSAISIFAIMAYLAPSDFAQAGPGLCPKSGTRRGRVASVNERLELTLTDRIQLKIAGVEPPHPTPENSELDIVSRDRLAQWLVGQDIAFQPVGPSLDRWGRLPAFVFAPRQDIGERQDDPLLPVGEALLDAGLARYEPGPAAHACKASLLAAEAAARQPRPWPLGRSVLCGHRRHRSPVLRREIWHGGDCRGPHYRNRRPEAAYHALFWATSGLGFFSRDFSSRAAKRLKRAYASTRRLQWP